MALSSVFNIAQSSLFAHQQALAVSSLNLTNANNPNYSRQVVSFGTVRPSYRAPYTFGTGVAVQDVKRISNDITNHQIRTNNQSYYEADKRADVLQEVESLFSEPTEYGLSNQMTLFFGSWDELAVDPSSTTMRSEVISSAQRLTEKFNTIYTGIQKKRIDIKAEAENITDHVNTIIEQLHLVNKQIYDGSVVKNNVNDLLDTRDAMLDELSQYVDINVSIDKNNVASVAIGGAFAVDGSHFNQFSLEQDGDRIKLMVENSENEVRVNGGSLNAVTELYNEELPNQLAALDDLAISLMENVNAIHKQGYTITDPQETNIEFFTDYEYGKLVINEDIIDDPKYLAVSGDGKEGDSSIAIQMAKLKDKQVIEGKTLGESYSNFVTGVANKITGQKQKTESFGIVLRQLEQIKQEKSGVSTDEEMINVMKYQSSYEAASKLISVADELLQTLLSLV